MEPARTQQTDLHHPIVLCEEPAFICGLNHQQLPDTFASDGCQQLPCIAFNPAFGIIRTAECSPDDILPDGGRCGIRQLETGLHDRPDPFFGLERPGQTSPEMRIKKTEEFPRKAVRTGANSNQRNHVNQCRIQSVR